jgi:8-oxo-dGTP diphosphatase
MAQQDSQIARQQVYQTIMEIAPFDALEQEHHAEALAWIDSGQPIFRLERPAIPPQHLVSYVLLVSENAVLLVNHRRSGLWLPTGGHVEPDEAPQVTAQRELEEELGLLLPLEQFKVRFITVTQTVGQERHTDVSLWYILSVARGIVLKPCTEEFTDVQWFAFDQVPTATDPHLERCLAKWQALSK